MRAVIALLAVVSIAGCNSEEKVDMSSVKSPQAGALVPNQHVSEKPTKPGFRIVKGGEGTGLIVK